MKHFINLNKRNKNLYISKEVLNRIINNFKSELIENKKIFTDLYELDVKKNDFSINFNAIINLLEEYKNGIILKKEKEISIASYYGNLFITVNLCMQTLIKKTAIIAIIEDKLLGLNTLVVNIFNNILKEYKIEKTIEIFNNISLEEIKETQNSIDFLTCIGNSNTYYKFLKNDIKNLRFIPFKNTALFCNDSYFEELKYEMYKFSLCNFIELEIYNDLEEFIECVNIDNKLENVVVFTKSKKEMERCNEKIKNHKLYINKNPFKDEKFKISY